MYSTLWPHLLGRFQQFRTTDFYPWASLLKMKFLVGHGGLLVALFTWDDCLETLLWVETSFLLILPWQLLFEQDMRALGQVCSTTTSMLARSAFYLNLFRKLFQGEVCLKLYGTPYGLFTKGEKGKIIGSSIKVSLKHKENMDFECIEFS